MREVVVSSFSEFHEEVMAQGGGTLYRGVCDADNHPLIPSIGRHMLRLRGASFPEDRLRRVEDAALWVFRTEAAGFGAQLADDWELLALAQHHGLPTRLLDWSLNPLVALFFASEKGYNCDAAVYAFYTQRWIHHEKQKTVGPFELTENAVYFPGRITPRIRAQEGHFTIQPDPTVPFEDSSLVRFRVRASARDTIRHVLLRYGVHEKSLFPDFDGLARYIRRVQLAEG